MSLRDEPRWKLLELGVSVVLLFAFVAIVAGPRKWFAGPTFPPHVVLLSGIGFWAAPAALGALGAYHAITLGIRPRSVVVGALAGLTLLVLLMNFHTTATSPGGPFRYEGRGMFFGPFVSLFTACLLALVVLGAAVEDALGF